MEARREQVVEECENGRRKNKRHLLVKPNLV